MHYKKPNILCYRIAQIVCWLVASFVFGRCVLRNEIKGRRGPFVVIANHQSALDFVNLIGLTARPMSFVISNSFFSTLPIGGFLRRLGVIPKQQFQTTLSDMKKMKAVIDNGAPLVIYPAGLMCEDGLSTPIPKATYKFLKWLGADVYVAKTSGSYFVMPKWAKGLRPGRTYIDVYKLIDREELAEMSLEAVREKAENALLFDAYREQEEFLVKYRRSADIRGLENVLYICPHCMGEFTVRAEGGSILRCCECGYELEADEYGFLHRRSDFGPDMRYVSDWSRLIHAEQKRLMESGVDTSLSTEAQFQMLDYDKHKFVDVGYGVLSLSEGEFFIKGEILGSKTEIVIPARSLPTLPFSPGKYLEIQHGADIYRCRLTDGKLVMKFINILKINHELSLLENEVKT